jgi:hypothetical protein
MQQLGAIRQDGMTLSVLLVFASELQRIDEHVRVTHQRLSMAADHVGLVWHGAFPETLRKLCKHTDMQRG